MIVPRTQHLFVASLASYISSIANGRFFGARRFFPTWTYESHCKSMEWNSLPDLSITINAGSRLEVWKRDSGSYNVSFVGFPSNNSMDDIPESLPGFLRLDPTILGSNNTDDGILTIQNGTTFCKVRTGQDLSDLVTARAAGKSIATQIKKRSKQPIVTVQFWMSAMVGEGEDGFPNAATVATYMQELVTSIWVSLYNDQRYKSQPILSSPSRAQIKLELLVESEEPNIAEPLQQAVIRAREVAKGVYLARDIVQAPHNVLNSASLAESATRLASSGRHLYCRIRKPPQSMGAFWAVGRGSETPPKLIHIIYRGPGRTRRKLGVVGKGLLFDTGGYSIKTSTGMESMKVDCGGAGACLGAAAILDALAPPHVEVHFVIAACENMINERAMVPGDILQASNGKTIEVLNTDAEGRLTLADALVYADETLKCEEIVELSTLTGACMAALGPSYAGLFSESSQLCQDLMESSKSTGELLWQLPMAKAEYGEWIKSNIADLRNIGTSRFAGATTAALFLQEFVSSSKPFAHLDIAGTAFRDKQATGFGARLVAQWVASKSLDCSMKETGASA